MCRFASSMVLALAGSLAFAPPSRAGSDETKARKACLSGNYQKGVEILSDLFVRTENPVYIYNQGRCFEQNGRCEEAINRFREYLRKAEKASAEEKADAEKHILDCKALLREKTTPAPARASGPEPEAEIARGSAAAAVPRAEGAVPAPAPATTPGGVPPSPPPAAGAAAPDQLVANPAVPAPSPGRGLRIAGIVCGVVGVGSIATGIYFYSRARSYSDKVSNQTTPDPSDDSAGKNAETMQWVFYGIGGAAIGTGALLYALGWPTADNNHATATITPMLGPGLAGISARGAF